MMTVTVTNQQASSPLTWECIEAEYRWCLENALDKVPVSKWRHTPTGVTLDSHRSKYGQATPEGLVLINRAFIGTKCILKLRETIFHELAHLAVGLSNHHNQRFRKMECIFLDGLKSPETEKTQIMANNGYLYRLLAFGQSGAVYDLGGAFRRTKKYTEYRPSARPSRIKTDQIIRFEYVSYLEPVPAVIMTEIN